MGAKNRQKEIKKIQKEIERLKIELRKIELRPCHGDAELKSKDEEVLILKKEIYELEKSANQVAIYISGIGSPISNAELVSLRSGRVSGSAITGESSSSQLERSMVITPKKHKAITNR